MNSDKMYLGYPPFVFPKMGFGGCSLKNVITIKLYS